MIVNQLNADQGDHVKKGQVLAVLDRSTLDTQLAQNEASRIQAEANIAQTESQIADAEVAVRQASEALERADDAAEEGLRHPGRARQCRQRQGQRQGQAGDGRSACCSGRRRRSPSSRRRRTSITIQIDKTEVKAPCRRAGAVAQRDARRHRVLVRRPAVPAGARRTSSSLPPTSPRRRCRSLPRACRPRSASPAGSSPVAGKIRLIAPGGRPEFAARHDPHLAAVGSRCRASAISRRAEIETLRRRARRRAGFGRHLCRQRRLPAEGRGRPREDRRRSSSAPAPKAMSRSSRASPTATRWWRAPAPSWPTATWSRRCAASRRERSSHELEFLRLGDPQSGSADPDVHRADRARADELLEAAGHALPQHRRADRLGHA